VHSTTPRIHLTIESAGARLPNSRLRPSLGFGRLKPVAVFANVEEAQNGGHVGHRVQPRSVARIVTTQSSCHTARALRGIRFLSDEAPRLPLTPCTAGASCPCSYKHHADRHPTSKTTRARVRFLAREHIDCVRRDHSARRPRARLVSTVPRFPIVAIHDRRLQVDTDSADNPPAAGSL